MKFLTKSLALAAVLAGFAVSAKAQSEVATQSYIVAASSTTNVAVNTVKIDCSAQQNVVLKWTIQAGGAGTDLCGLRLFPSIDGTLPSTPTLATGYSLAIAANGTTPVIVQTNFTVQGYRYLHVAYITNGVAQVLTNRLDYYVKRNAP